MKITKRLLGAIASLIASLILCVGVCLAWFAVSENVGGKGMSPQFNSTNISKFNVVAYRLEAGGNSSYILGERVEDDPIEMAAYGGLQNDTTALLLEITYSFVRSGDKNYNIYVQCDSRLRPVTEGEEEDTFECNLSDAVVFYDATVVQGEEGKAATVKIDAKAVHSFIGEVETEDGTEECKRDIKLNSQALSDATTAEATIYVVIDYDDIYIASLYAIAVDEHNGTLNSAIGFYGDIKFFMEEVSTEN